MIRSTQIIKTITALVIVLFSLTSFSQKPKLKVGKKAPLFELETSKTSQFSLQEVLDNGNKVVLVFYQGSWNPYDLKYLKKLQEAKSGMESKNAILVLVTREKFKFIEELKSEEDFDMIICSDPEWYTMSAYGVAYKLSKNNAPSKYKTCSTANYNHTGSKDDMVPVPATFVIDVDQKISFMHFDWDYRQHPEVSEILNSL